MAVVTQMFRVKEQVAGRGPPALFHKITLQEAGSDSSTTIQLGQRIPGLHVVGPSGWSPQANESNFYNLWRRVLHGDNMLATNLAAAFGIIDALFVQPEKEYRLVYDGSPVTDIGLCLGLLKVPISSTICYKDSTGKDLKSPDKDDHWWIYVASEAGEEYVLDLCAFPFNVTSDIRPAPYFPGQSISAPIAFCTQKKGEGHACIWEEKQRWTMLRDPQFQEFALNGEKDGRGIARLPVHALRRWAESKMGRSMEEPERLYFQELMSTATYHLGVALEDRKWKAWPAKPVLQNA